MEATGKSWTYKASDMCGPNANTTGFKDPGYMYDVLLKDLKPSTRYYYSYGSKGVSCTRIFVFFLIIMIMYDGKYDDDL